MGSGQLAVQPGPGQLPFPLHCGARDLERLRRFFDGHPCEEAAFDDSGLPLGYARESIERPIEIDQGFNGDTVRCSGAGISGSERDMYAPPLGRVPALRVVDEDLSHQSSRQGEEMRPVTELNPVQAQELRERLVHEARGLEGPMGLFASELPVSDVVQLFVDERGEPMRRLFVASAMGPQEVGNLVLDRML